MAEHTPGPWRYSGLANVYAYYVHHLLHSRVVACVPADELEGGEEERQANAHLIAAAPELKAAGALALNQLSYALQRASFEENNVATTAIGIAMSKLRAALAKAEGRS